MSLHLFLDSGLTTRVSENGDMSSPDSDTYNGTDGETKDRQLFIANAQTETTQEIAMGETTLEVTEAVFGNNQFIYVEAEKMRVISGGGTTTLIVERGVDGTSTGYHPSGAPVISAYNYTNLVVQPIDVDSTSVEAAWITLGLNQASLDSNTPGQSMNLGDKNYDNIMSFWRRVAVPPSTPVQNKTDLRLRIVGVEHPA